MDAEEEQLVLELIEIIDSHYEGDITKDKMEEICSELLKNLVYYKLHIQQ
jgi:hypothetical protein